LSSLLRIFPPEDLEIPYVVALCAFLDLRLPEALAFPLRSASALPVAQRDQLDLQNSL